MGILNSQSYYGAGAINPMPTPNVPQNVNFTRQSVAGGFDPFAGAFSPANFSAPTAPTYDYSNAKSTIKTVPSGGGGQPTGGQPQGGQPTGGQPTVDPYAQLRGEISSGWDNYINSLNGQLEGLNTQRQGQEQIALSGYQTGINNLGLQKDQGIQSLNTERTNLEQNQVKTLRDLVENQRQAFQAGNNFLGTKGASDSSAANQYSFALAKESGRQRGDIMMNTSNQLQEINQRETNLNNIYNTEVNNLEQTKQAQFGQIAQWFGDAQNKIKLMQSQGQLNKSQDLQALSKDILNQAISEMNRINTEISGRRTALENWAMTNSKNISELKANMQQVSAFSSQLPQANQIAGTPQVDQSGNMRTALNYAGGLSEEEKRRRALLGY